MLFLVWFICTQGVHAQSSAVQSWATLCSTNVENAYQQQIHSNISLIPPILFIGQDRKPDPNLDINSSWGVTYSDCKRSCGNITVFEFNSFASEATNWLFPWLALIAQIPFETSTPYRDIMSALVTVGSPMLATYSMIISMLLKRRIRGKFDDLMQRADNPRIKRTCPQLSSRLKYACTVVEESLQVPMRACEGPGWLSGLVVRAESQAFWRHFHDRLLDLRRGITISLIAQMLIAIVSWLFTVLTASVDDGQVEISEAIAASTLWMWLLPVVAGWVCVGTQFRKGTVANALRSAIYATEHKEKDVLESPMFPSLLDSMLKGIRVTTGIIEYGDEASEKRPILGHNAEGSATDVQRLDSNSTLEPDYQAGASVSPAASVQFQSGEPSPASMIDSSEAGPYYNGLSLVGAEASQGPINNYARVFTHWAFFNTIATAFGRFIVCLEQQNYTRPDYPPEQPVNVHRDSTCSCKQTVTAVDAIGLDASQAYRSFSHTETSLKLDLLQALIVGLLLQWGTTGAALVIVYYTPPVGFGCRSASFTIYGALATLSCSLLVSAAILSHLIVVRHQARRSIGHVLPVAFLMTRFCGNVLAAINAIWLVLSCVLQLAGIFDSWYASLTPSRHLKFC